MHVIVLPGQFVRISTYKFCWGGYLSLRCRNLCYDEFSLGVFCVGIGGVWMCGLVDSLSFVGERVDHDSPAKLCKFNIVSMGSRTNLGDFVL